jgi:hypothetical protein
MTYNNLNEGKLDLAKPLEDRADVGSEGHSQMSPSRWLAAHSHLRVYLSLDLECKDVVLSRERSMRVQGGERT